VNNNLKAMDKTFKTILIISIIVFGVGFFFTNSVQAVQQAVQFEGKNIYVDFDGLPFVMKNWAPGDSEQKTITIKNDENFDINIYFKAKKTLGDDILADVLTITIDNKSNHLSDLLNNNIVLTPVNSKESQNYNVAISFDEDAGNKYQDKTINFDFIIVAEQIGGKKEEVIIPGGGTYIPITPTTPTTETGEVTATPGEGGITSLTNPDGSKVKLTIPARAVSENTNFSINLVDINSVNQPAPESGLFLIAGQVYEIKAQVGTKSITVFNKPLTLTFIYTNDQIKGLDENSLKIYYWDKTQNQWVAIENSEVNIDNNSVTASVDHFTIFALMGSKIELIKEEKPTEEIGPKEIVGPTKEIGPSEITKEIPKKITEEVLPPKEEVTPLEKKVVTVPPEQRVPGKGWAPLLLASLASSWGNLLEGKLFNNPIFWALIASLGILFSGFSLIEKPRKIFGAIGFLGIWSLLISSLFLPLSFVEQLRMPLPDFIVLPIGILFFLAGIFVIYLAFKKLSFSVASDIAKPKELVTSGIYGVVRHPLYLGLILAYLGWCFIFKALLALLFAPVAFLFLLILTNFEEKDLIKTYDNIYREYQKRVPQRIIPKIL
jgi:protein-S-isoprenylcysteine O-methyltransferase Ste14